MLFYRRQYIHDFWLFFLFLKKCRSYAHPGNCSFLFKFSLHYGYLWMQWLLPTFFSVRLESKENAMPLNSFGSAVHLGVNWLLTSIAMDCNHLNVSTIVSRLYMLSVGHHQHQNMVHIHDLIYKRELLFCASVFGCVWITQGTITWVFLTPSAGE